MASDDKKDFSNLADYYQVVTPKDLLVGFDKTTTNSNANRISDNANINHLCMNLIVNSEGGAYSIKDIIKKISDENNDKEIKKNIEIYSTLGVEREDFIKSVSSLFKRGAGDIKTSVGIIFSNSPFISTNVRDINLVTLFLNTIPTLELSKAVPYVDVRFQFKRQPYEESTRKVQIPSLVKFLQGSIKVENNSIEKAMLDSQKKTTENGDIVTELDMGIFLSPQTMVNKNLAYDQSSADKLIAANIIDKFRPLASIGDITIDVQASPSYEVAYKTLKMNMILYDRSRLTELADLIRPNTYAGTEMVIRYGWNHPDKSGKNPYANLINKMQMEERYAITNSSYTISETGIVKFDLLFHMLGHIQLWISRTSENADYKNQVSAYTELKETISELLTQLGFEGEKEVRAKNVLQKIEDSVHSGETKEVKKEIDTFIKSIKSKKGQTQNNNIQKLTEVLQDKLNPTKQGSTANTLKTTISRFIEDKKKLIIDNENDVFLSKDDEKRKQVSKVSLAKLFSVYVLDPIRVSNKFSEVQVIFYRFNSHCGPRSDTNIGQFPIDVKKFQKLYTDFLKSKNTLDISCAEFCKSIIKDAIVSDPSSEAYGLKSFYDENGKIKKGRESAEADKRQELLEQYGSQVGATWKHPVLEFYVECLSKKEISNLNIETSGKDSILRIHVYDKQSSGWEPFLELKKAQKAINTVTLTSEQQSDLSKAFQEYKKIFPSETEPLYRKGENSTLHVEMNSRKIKNFISSFVPTLTFGSNNSSIKNVSVQSIQNPLLNTVNMQRTTWASTTTPAGSSVTGLPLTVTPGSISMSVVGCPLLHLNQQYFIDLDTNTTLDNLYTLTGITHTIGQGKFDSSLKFAWSDAWGTYENLGSTVSNLITKLKKIQ